MRQALRKPCATIAQGLLAQAGALCDNLSLSATICPLKERRGCMQFR